MKIKHFCVYHLPFMIMILVLGFIGCISSSASDNEINDHKFKHGEIVLTKLGHERGMIVARYIYKYKYEVRFSSDSKIVMQEYELEKIHKDTIVNKDSLISELTSKLTEATNKLAESDNLKERVKALIIEAEK